MDIDFLAVDGSDLQIFADPKEKLNSMRREQYAKDGDKIRAQKREAYKIRVENEKVKNGKPTQQEILKRIKQTVDIPNNGGYIANKVADETFSLDIRHQKYLQHIDKGLRSKMFIYIIIIPII